MWLLLLEYCGPWLGGGRIARRCFEVGHDGRQSSHVGPDAESAGASFRHRKTGAAAEGSYSRDRSAHRIGDRCGTGDVMWPAAIWEYGENLHNFRQFVFAIVCARWTAVQILPVKCLEMLKSREAGLLIEHQEVWVRAFRMPAPVSPA